MNKSPLKEETITTIVDITTGEILKDALLRNLPDMEIVEKKTNKYTFGKEKIILVQPKKNQQLDLFMNW